MGDRVQTGALIYTVFESRWAAQLRAQGSDRIPANRFLLLRMSIVNSSSTENSVPAFTLVDDNGQRYQEVGNGDGVPQWAGFVRRVKPADTLTGNVLFDVPLKHFKLEVSDESDDNKALVDIPLTFGSDSVPVPGPVPQAPQAPVAPPVTPR
jgi:uncharacterized protein DUF4352